MYSLDYFLANTRGFRKILKWWNSKKLSSFIEQEQVRIKNNPLDLRNYEKKIFSQNGEDGIISEIFKRISVTNKFFVEFGVENGQECNSRRLLEEEGWSGLWMDGSENNCTSAKLKFKNYGISVQQAFIDKENIETLLRLNNVPQEFDLLVIDIDGNDYWVWQAISYYKPRLVVIEYNSSYPPSVDWVMPYNANHLFDGTRHYGATLKSLSLLAKEKGYKLIGCDKTGVNAFFLRADLFKEGLFLDKDLEYHYSSPKYQGLFFGHPKGRGPWIKKGSAHEIKKN